MTEVKVIGAGLAGCEAAWQLAQRGCKVTLYEMRPRSMTPAHKTAAMAELVCSNSLGAANPDSAAGLLKLELSALNSLIMACAHRTRVPAGGALAVDRTKFAQAVTQQITGHPNIAVVRQCFQQFPDPPAIIASGPLTAGPLAEAIRARLGQDMLYFYDAAAPIIYGDSIDGDMVFRASRYGKGGADYLNCPLSEDQYREFYHNLVTATQVDLKEFEKKIYFEHCLPIEELARRGYKTLAFGPLKPVGLVDPRTGQQPFAVVQLRQEDDYGQLYNMVGFQTSLTWGEQKRVFRLIPGLQRAEFARFGVMHRNSYINAPSVLADNFQLRDFPGIFIAGQLAGVEGYLESAASGLVAALALWSQLRGQSLVLPPQTMIGGLTRFVTRSTVNFQPVNANFGLLPPVAAKGSKGDRRRAMVARAEEKISMLAKNLNL